MGPAGFPAGGGGGCLRALRAILPALALAGCSGGSDDPAEAPVTISVADASVTEADSGQLVLEFSVTLSRAADAEVRVDYATDAGTATGGSDFIESSRTLAFPAGTTIVTIPVIVLDDPWGEAEETLTIELGNAVNASLMIGQGSGRILDNDGGPAVLAVGDASAAEGDAVAPALEFAVTLSSASETEVIVEYATEAGTATPGDDFTTVSGALTFVPGATSLSVQVPVLDDQAGESDETLTLTLGVPGTPTVLQATGTILDDDGGAPVIGLDARPGNNTCVAPPRPTGDALVATADAFPAAPALGGPTKILQAPGDPARWFVVRISGRVDVMDVANPAATSLYLDFSPGVYTSSDSEGGLLGMAFHPDFPNTPEVFMSYTGATGDPGQPMKSVISRVILDDTDAPASPVEQVLLTVDQPGLIHKGGDIAFGADGYLYIGLGDGGDPVSSQDTTRLLGSMLRIDVLDVPWPSPAYRIPPTNPYSANPPCGPGANAADCPEIYAWGFRNPWRWSFDLATGTLWMGDVGEGAWEEVNSVESGGNYGWPCREGAHDRIGPGCPVNGTTDPVSEYARADGASVTGGFVYRGAAIPALQGRYVFGDFVRGTIMALKDDGEGAFTNEELIDTPYSISSFGFGEDGELYFSDFTSDRIYRLAPAGPATPDAIPNDLAATGCVDPADPAQPAAGLIPYDINAPFWSDAAEKSRYLGLPDGTTIEVAADGDWDLPAGTVIVKHFRLAGKLIETRLLMRHPDGIWAGYTYEWNDTQSAATRVKGGKTRPISGQSWIYPSETQCMQCHTGVAGFSLGPETAQLNRSFTYPSTGRTANQLLTLEAIGMFSAPLPDAPPDLPAMPDPADGAAAVATRARSYLHTNCAQCHRVDGPTPAAMDLRYASGLSATNACDVAPLLGDLDITNARILAPGDASRSVLLSRMSRRDVHGMPPLGSNIADAAGIELMVNWVNGLTSCQDAP